MLVFPWSSSCTDLDLARWVIRSQCASVCMSVILHGWPRWKRLRARTQPLYEVVVECFDVICCYVAHPRDIRRQWCLSSRLICHEENPAEEFSNLGGFSEKMFGQRSGSQSLKFKGAETGMLVPLSIWP